MSEEKAEVATAAPSEAPAAPHFEIKKWSAVAMWSWDICADTCAICRNNLNEPSIEYQVACIGCLFSLFALHVLKRFFTGEPFTEQ